VEVFKDAQPRLAADAPLKADVEAVEILGTVRLERDLS